MLRAAAVVVLAGAIGALGQGRAQAADTAPLNPPPSEACMAPIAAGAADPVVRDVHFHVTTGSPLVSITLCVASAHAETLQGAAANVGIFSHDGVLINYAGQSYSNVAPLTNPAATGPKLVLMYGVAIEVDPKYGQAFAPDTVVALSTVACTKPAPACDPGPTRTATFLLPVQIDQDLPGGKPAK